MCDNRDKQCQHYRDRWQKFLYNTTDAGFWSATCSLSSMSSWEKKRGMNTNAITENSEIDMPCLISLLDVLPSWPGSSSSKNRTCPPPPPPSDDINIDDMRSLNSLVGAISSLTLVLRLCRLEFGGSSSIKPLAHSGHVYSYQLNKWQTFN